MILWNVDWYLSVIELWALWQYFFIFPQNETNVNLGAKLEFWYIEYRLTIVYIPRERHTRITCHIRAIMFIAVSNRSSVRVFDSLVKYQIKPVFKHRGRKALGGGRLGHSLHKNFWNETLRNVSSVPETGENACQSSLEFTLVLLKK